MARDSGTTSAGEQAPRPFRSETAALVSDALTFAASAGFANVVVFLSVFRRSVTHMTGRARNLSVALESFDWELVGVSIGLIFSFICGSVISGLLVPERDLDRGLPYRRVFLAEGILLTVAATMLINDIEAGVYLAAMSFGLQNGRATFYRGVVIRTSHVTGIITDLGVDVGLLLRRQRVPSDHVLIKVGVLVGFVGGGVVGAIAFDAFGVAALYFSAGWAATMTVVYWIWGRKRTEAVIAS